MSEIQYQSYGVDPAVAEAYAESLRKHIAFVQEAGRQLRVPEPQLAIHDQSKWTAGEFPGYALHFKGGGAPDQFAYAWLHHIHHNPHHWQHWIFADGYTPAGSQVQNGAVEMPTRYVLEMIADWMGASRAYTGSFDMFAWLVSNFPKIRLHSNTAEYLRYELDRQGYADIVWTTKFAHEAK